jgi:large subunit ribosomal protein L9
MVKVIFLENINEHKVGDIKSIPDGYARNFLIPKGIAKLATDAEVKNIESQIKKLQSEEAKKVTEAEKVAEKMSQTKLTLSEEVNEDGHLYGAVTAKEISEHLKTKKFEIDPSEIVIEEPIKELGEYEITVKVGHGVKADLKIVVKRK